MLYGPSAQFYAGGLLPVKRRSSLQSFPARNTSLWQERSIGQKAVIHLKTCPVDCFQTVFLHEVCSTDASEALDGPYAQRNASAWNTVFTRHELRAVGLWEKLTCRIAIAWRPVGCDCLKCLILSSLTKMLPPQFFPAEDVTVHSTRAYSTGFGHFRRYFSQNAPVHAFLQTSADCHLLEAVPVKTVPGSDSIDHIFRLETAFPLSITNTTATTSVSQQACFSKLLHSSSPSVVTFGPSIGYCNGIASTCQTITSHNIIMDGSPPHGHRQRILSSSRGITAMNGSGPNLNHGNSGEAASPVADAVMVNGSTAARIPLHCEVTNPSRYIKGYRHIIIVLHGKASNGADLRSQLFSARANPRRHGGPRTLDKLLDCCKWVFPTAPYPARTRPGGFQVSLPIVTFSSTSHPHSDIAADLISRVKWFHTPRMWFPQDTPDEEQQPALEQSIDRLLDLVREEERDSGLSRSNIFIGGSGQGFAVAAGALLADGRGDFAGLIGLNGWVPYTQQLVEEMPEDARRGDWVNRARALLCPEKHSRLQQPSLDLGGESCDIIRKHNSGEQVTPIFMAHPNYDNIIHCSETARANDVFREMGWNEDWYDYPRDDGRNQRRHGINQPQGVDDLCRWIQERLRNCGGHPEDGHLNSFDMDQVFVGAPMPDEFVAYMRVWRDAGSQ